MRHFFRIKKSIQCPEEFISKLICQYSTKYITADYYRENCDLKIDITEMPDISSESFDTILVFDVLEHVTDYKGTT